MLTKPDARPVFAHLARKSSQFKSDEGGSIAIFIVIMFVLILMLGGMAVDVTRFEMRRVALQETLDRATLAAANVILPKETTPDSVVTEWFSKAGLGDQLTVDYFPPTVAGSATDTSREATARAKVRSYNHFMQMLAKPYFIGDAVAVARQGVSKIEVIMVLDITGSMRDASGSKKKIDALREAAEKFVTVLKFSKDTGGAYTVDRDPKDLISIGMVPYASNVNIPKELREEFTYTKLSSWEGVPDAGVPETNCLEIPESTFGSTGLSLVDPIEMAAVSYAIKSRVTPGTNTTAGTTGTGTTLGGVITLNRNTPPAQIDQKAYKDTDSVVCNDGDNYATTGVDEAKSNQVVVPTTETAALISQIKLLIPRGRTSIAVGMRWGTALLDEDARDIYTAIRGGEAAMAGRPADNNAADTRKIIVLMTDGTHVASENIVSAYKTGLSPIWRGAADGNLVIQYTNGGLHKTDGLRPGLTATNTCSGWIIPGARNFFAPHRKADWVKKKNGTEAEGAGTGTNVNGGCDPLAWIAATGTPAKPSWTGSGAVRQLDWSEVWRYATVDWVIRQLYMRSGVDGTNNYNTVYAMFVAPYLVDEANMDALLATNCNAAKTAGFEVFGIVLGNDVTEAPVKNCSSSGTGYYHKVTDAANLTSTFEKIAVQISDLKLTQ